MGIIVSCFTGCGREFLKETYGDKIKIFDAVAEIPLTDVDGKINSELQQNRIKLFPLKAVIKSFVFFPRLEKTKKYNFNSFKHSG